MKSNKIDNLRTSECCGCGACYNKCPVGAITMHENDEGFLYPLIDESKCTNCGLCLKVCPSINAQFNNNPKPECYAAMANDEIRMKSSSGGMFTLLAEYILDKGGYVCGAAFAEDWSVHHIIVNNKQDLDKLRGSKYVQSNTESCYKAIKQLLENDKYVLFSGCPCQAAGLYTFLGKEYDKLLTVDILCHGAPSPGIWRKYLDDNFKKKNILNVNFRDKSKIGWSCSQCTITLNNEEQIVSEDYTRLFHNALIMRESCSNCNFSKYPRPADITLGDWWGISEYDKSLNDGKGLSFVLLNNEKGKLVFHKIKVKNTKINLQKNYNNGHVVTGLELHHNRAKFFKDIFKFNIKKLGDIYLNNKYDICLLTIFYANNYGAILVAYAVHKLISSLGYSILMLQKPANTWRGYIDKVPQAFAVKHYNLSRIYENIEDLKNLNNECESFVVGSDQMFNPSLHLDYSLLEFAGMLKNKIAFGTSFGHDAYKASENIIIKHRYLLDRFNHIALREKSENLCNNIFKIDAEEIIAPTLVLPRKEFEDLTKNVNLQIPDKYLLTYTLDVSPELGSAIEYIAQKQSLKIINIGSLEPAHRKNSDLKCLYDISPEEFLYLYEHASFVVTDSFHGTCFSVKFNKPFISLINNKRGGFRYKVFDKL